MKETSDLICGKAAVGGNYNSTRDIQTILCNSPFKEKIVQDYHRYILWKKKYNSYPAILDEDDYPEIIKGDYHFIRKVSEKYSADLMRKLLK